MTIQIRINNKSVLFERLKKVRDSKYPGMPWTKFFIQCAIDSEQSIKDSGEDK